MALLITGAGGFIGSRLAMHLHKSEDLILVDDWTVPAKVELAKGLNGDRWHRSEGIALLEDVPVDAIFHLGARTDTAEQDVALFDRLNVQYTKDLWRYCARTSTPFYYASSAATYGLGDKGFSDYPALISELQPLNPYGQSKQDVDLWIMAREQQPPVWAGFKFFNVYGPHEQYKGRMASVIWHTYQQIKSTGGMKLFRSHRADIEDGQQSRDFIHVDDVIRVLIYFYNRKAADINGIYNLGTGVARTFLDLAKLTFLSQGLQAQISFIDTPADIRSTYQYYTQADLTRLRGAGYDQPFVTLEDGVKDYVDWLRETGL